MTDAPDAPAEDRADAASPRAVERLARRLADEGRPFARVTVVRREPPVSANVGDRAVVTPDGDLVGWVGGAACAQSVATRAARAALADGEPRLVGLAPDPDAISRPGLESFPMTCHSDGTLELFVEPVTPAPRLVVVGDTPIARALVDLAGRLSYEVTAVVGDGDDGGSVASDSEDHPGADRVLATTDAEDLAADLDGATAVVVASMGAFDALGVAAAVEADASYVGLVASDRRAGEVFDRVADRTGREPEEISAAVTVPAGLDVGAETAGEIAVSVLAELVEVRRSGDAAGSVGRDASDSDDSDTSDTAGTDDTGDRPPDAGATDPTDANTAPGTAVDPVCGMTVDVGDAPAVEHAGERFHFCGEGCADAFADDPDRFAGRAEEVQ